MKINSTSRSLPLTLSGADEKTDIAGLSRLNTEIGLLYTATPEGRNRYPRWEWIREASIELKHASLHICGMGARVMLMDGRLAVSGFDRIQVNGIVESKDIERVCALYPQHTIITQHNDKNWPLLSVRSLNHAVLIDASGGRGESPGWWESPETKKAVGFAGGLGPDNLTRELPEIGKVARQGWWVDMEQKLRVDDWFSLERAQECVAALAG